MSEQAAAVVEVWHEAGLFDGVVLVADKGEIVWQGGVGLANRKTGTPNRADTTFPIASLTKQFTALLVMQQVERGVLHLDDTVSQILPSYRRDTGERISIQHLLRHTSGLPDIDPELYRLEDSNATKSDWVLEHYGSGDLKFEPGSEFSYTNTDYHLLARILEAKTGQTFEALLRQQILVPLGMHNTGIARRDALSDGWAHDYVATEAGEWIDAPPYRWENWSGAGAMYSTLEDLHRWNRALSSRELVSDATWQLMLTPRTDLPGGGNYVGLGSWVYPRPLTGTELAPTLIERRGAIGGYAILNVLVAGEDRWIILLANHYNEGIHTLPYAPCLPLDLLMVLYGQQPLGPVQKQPESRPH